MLSWLAGAALASLLGLPVPAGILGLALVLLLLSTGAMPLHAVKNGADWLLAQLLLFFVPALLAVLDHPEFLGLLGLKLLFVIVLGTLAVMLVTGMVVELATRRRPGPAPAAKHD